MTFGDDDPAKANPADSTGVECVPDDRASAATESDVEETDVESQPAFDSELELALQDAYPVLLDRLERSHFADWHRRNNLAQDLAHNAMVAVLDSCRRRRHIPGDVVG